MKVRDKIMRTLVIEEATKLRNMITQEEADNLKFSKLDSSQSDRCIYGQLSGNCFSDRAIELIKACASRVYKNWWFLSESKLNGSPLGLSRNEFWSPIEVFISQDETDYENNMGNGNNERLVQFIKKEIDELIFEN